MYNGSIINETATLAFAVKSDLTGGAFTAVKFSDTGVATAGDGDIPFGILTAYIVESTKITLDIKKNFFKSSVLFFLQIRLS